MDSSPVGTVTFLFTDIEGSSALAQQQPAELPALLARHHAILREAIACHGGRVFSTAGDGFCAAFPTAGEALVAALDAQRALQHEAWLAPVRERMGLHTGAAQTPLENAGDPLSYLTLTRVQRVMSVAHGGQVLLSAAAAELLRGQLPPSVSGNRSSRTCGRTFPRPRRAPGNATTFRTDAPGSSGGRRNSNRCTARCKPAGW